MRENEFGNIFICRMGNEVIFRMRKLSVLIFAVLLSFTGHGQAVTSKDSLQRLLYAAKTDTDKVNLYIEVGKQFATTDEQTAIQYYKRAEDLSKKISYADGVQSYYAEISNILSRKGLLDSCLATNIESLEWANKLGDSSTIAKAFLNIGVSYLRLDDMESAVSYFEKGRHLFARYGQTASEGRVDDILQSIAREMRQYHKGVTYGLQAVEKLSAINDSANLCYAYNNLGLNYIELKKYDSASYFLERAYKIALRSNDVTILTTYNLNLGYIHLLQGNFSKMKPFAEKALELSIKYEMPEYTAFALYALSDYYLSEKQYHSAKKYADSAMAIANRNNMKNVQLKTLPTLSSIAFAMQDTKTGFSYLNQYLELSNSIVNESVTKNTISIEKKFETEKKEAKIKLQQAELHKKNMLNYVFAGSAVALLLILLLGYRNYRNRQKLQQAKIDELETEKQLTATEAVLKGEEQERTRLAKDLHDGLGGMLSGIKHSLSSMKGNLVMTPDNAQAFERSIDMLNSSINEMRRVAHNLMPEILVKYGLDTALKEYCDDITRSGVVIVNYQSMGMNEISIKQTTAVTIYRIVQELTNNAIKHGAAQNLLVQAHASAAEKTLVLTVEDDGKGFDVASLKQARGMGWSNIQNRVDFLKGKIDLSSEQGKGTSVLIEIKM